MESDREKQMLRITLHRDGGQCRLLAGRLGGRELTPPLARNNEYQSLVQLYKALGGAWK